MSDNGFPSDMAGFGDLQNFVSTCIDLDTRIPQWPFYIQKGFVSLFQFDRVLLFGNFGEVLSTLATHYEDDHVTVLGLEPKPSYYIKEYGLFPAFQLEKDSIETGYWEAITYKPDDDETGSLGISLNAIAITGSSRSWAIMGQRDWEIALLVTPDDEGPWQSCEVPSFDRNINIDLIGRPPGWGTPLSEEDRLVFAQTIREHGSGL